MFSEVQALPINVPLLYVILGSFIHIFFFKKMFDQRLCLVNKMSAH